MLTGVLLGLGAATAQSLSYVFSRMFTTRYRGESGRLLLLSHVIMGALALILLAVVWPRPWPPASLYARHLAAASLTYFLGQGFLIMALRRTDASRISPLLGIKIVMLALLGVLWLHAHYTPAQWGAVALCVTSAALLNWTGGGVGPRTLLLVTLVCVGYCLSDLNIGWLTGHFTGTLGLARGSALAASFCYLSMGLVSLALLGMQRIFHKVRSAPPKRAPLAMWLHAAPFGVAWFGAMILLYACFSSSIGVLGGNIVQATRGVISIGLGALIAWAGHEHLERKVAPRVLARRILAAFLMLAAIALFQLGKK